MTTVKERPILFNSPMVRAILDGRKTQTRRVVKPQPEDNGTGRWSYIVSSTDKASEGCFEFSIQDPAGNKHTNRGRERATFSKRSPFGQPGDRLWGREAWTPGYYHDPDHEDGPKVSIIYGADGHQAMVNAPSYDFAEEWLARFSEDGDTPPAWRPSIHMPRWASRIILEIVDVRVEQLQAITEEDAIAEGAARAGRMWPSWYFREDIWNPLARPGARWNDNPWVWSVEFKPLEATR